MSEVISKNKSQELYSPEIKQTKKKKKKSQVEKAFLCIRTLSVTADP